MKKKTIYNYSNKYFRKNGISKLRRKLQKHKKNN